MSSRRAEAQERLQSRPLTPFLNSVSSRISPSRRWSARQRAVPLGNCTALVVGCLSLASCQPRGWLTGQRAPASVVERTYNT